MYEFEYQQSHNAILWPRNEVLQLVIPQIAGNGKTLTYELVFAAVRRLVKFQNPDGIISYDRWLVTAKDTLKWNDSIISLFWETLIMASTYVADGLENTMRGSLGGGSKYDTVNNGVDVNHLSIFLALHVDDSPNPTSISSPRHNAYDTVWPSAALIEREDSLSNMNLPIPVSPSGHKNNRANSFSSPSRISHHLPSNSSASSSSPIQSPRSPKAGGVDRSTSNSNMNNNTYTSPQSPSNASSSMKRLNITAMTMHTPQTRSAAQHLISLKQKLPYLLKVISTDELMSSTSSIESSPLHENLLASPPRNNEDQESKSERSQSSMTNLAGLEFMISKSALNSLSLVISGGWSKSDNIKKLSVLHPYWNHENDATITLSNSVGSGSGSSVVTNNFPLRNRSDSLSTPITPLNISSKNPSGKLFETNNNFNSSTKASAVSLSSPNKYFDSKGSGNGHVSLSLSLSTEYKSDRKEEFKNDLIHHHHHSNRHSGDADTLCFSDLTQWLDDNLTINDHIFPLSSSSTTHHQYSVLINSPSYVSLGGLGPSSNQDFKNTTLISPRRSLTDRSGESGGSSKTASDILNSPRRESSSSKTFGTIAEEQILQYPTPEAASLGPTQNPFRFTASMLDLKINAPTIIKNCATTVVYSVSDPELSVSMNRSFTRGRSTSNSAPTAPVIFKSSFKRTIGNSPEDKDKENDSRDKERDSLTNLDTDGIENINLLDSVTTTTAPTSDHQLNANKSIDNSHEDIESNDGSLSARSTKSDLGLGKTNSTFDQLPHAVISGSTGAHIYLLAPYTSATISHCCDCEIVLGAVAGTLIINYCDRVSISATCRKLIIVGSIDCRLCIATLTTSIIIGDCRGLTFGPLNMTYRSLKSHLNIASLQSLVSVTSATSAPPSPMSSSSSSSEQHKMSFSPSKSSKSFHSSNSNHSLMNSNTYYGTHGGGSGGLINQWSVFTDVLSCLDTVATAGSPSGYALDAASASPSLTLPVSPSAVAHIMPHDHFKLIYIPSSHEYDVIQNSPIHMPMLYNRALQDKYNKICSIRDKMLKVHQSDNNGISSINSTSNTVGVAGSTNEATNNSLSISSLKLDEKDGNSGSNSNSNKESKISVAAAAVNELTDKKFKLENNLNDTGNSGNSSTMNGLPNSLNHTFMEWIAATGRSSQLLQLVKLDAADSNLIEQSSIEKMRAMSSHSTECSTPTFNSSAQQSLSSMPKPLHLDLSKM